MMLTIGSGAENVATLDWTGGNPLCQIQRRSFDSSASWADFGEVTTNRSMVLPLDGPGAMFRVIEVAH
ncbi:MAG TPA: hypothetical protein VJW76_13565 [Verrucomicrobiae bacterium]|nr:hypothetical protein [Verrucomicrobiae bacterium]